MEYVTAGPEHIDGIHHVMQSTIRAVYPKYYPAEVVDFFCQLHSREHVQEGVESGNRDVLLDEGKIVGVGCADGNHITSVYVLPECQGRVSARISSTAWKRASLANTKPPCWTHHFLP